MLLRELFLNKFAGLPVHRIHASLIKTLISSFWFFSLIIFRQRQLLFDSIASFLQCPLRSAEVSGS